MATHQIMYIKYNKPKFFFSSVLNLTIGYIPKNSKNDGKTTENTLNPLHKKAITQPDIAAKNEPKKEL